MDFRGRDSGALAWYAVQTKPRYEQITDSMLRGKGFESFLPVRKVRKRWSDRYKELEQPLFPGYLFCRFDVYQRLPILITPGVNRIVGIGKIPCPVPDQEIEALQVIENSGLNYDPWPFLKVGERVRIETGPLANLEGILVQVKNTRRLVVSVTLLQRAVAAEVDCADVTPLDGLGAAYEQMLRSRSTWTQPEADLAPPHKALARAAGD